MDKKWLLSLNIGKCKVLTLGTEVGLFGYEMETGSNRVRLENSSLERDLGVQVDSKLTFEEHIWGKVKTANKIVGLIRRNFGEAGASSLLTIYKAMVRPHLEYAQAVWSPYKVKLVEALEKVQKRATKLIPGLNKLDYEERLRRLKLPTLVYRRWRGDMITTFRIMNGLNDEGSGPGLVKCEYRATRGHTIKLYKQQSRTNRRKFSFSQRVVDPWNALPATVIEAKSVNSFKSRLDSHMEDQDLVYNYRKLFDRTR
jgi:ribonucleases P/MRP protein subunit RPP40